jgi:hypothetical protein
MRKIVLPLTAVLLFCLLPSSAQAQTSEERTITGRFGADDPSAEDAGTGSGDRMNRWFFLGARLGPSLRFYTPSGDTAFTGGDSYGASLETGIQMSLQIVRIFSIQAEAIFTWDNASLWNYTVNTNNIDIDRYTRQFSSLSLKFPLAAKLNFYPGKFRISPFAGAYFILPLGTVKTSSPLDEEKTFSYSISPPLGILGGISVGLPLGPGIIFTDIRYAADLGEMELEGGGPQAYRRHMTTISFGYEFSFFEKRKKGEIAK